MADVSSPSARSLSALETSSPHLPVKTNTSLCPILMLPSELLTAIFKFYLPPYPIAPKNAGPGSPTYLLGICRAWRTVALNSPVLWRAMRQEDFVESTAGADVLCQWLIRSGTIPISLDLTADVFYFGEEWSAFVAAVLANRSRWEYLRWRLDSDKDRIHLITGAAPSIIDLNIGTGWQPHSERQILALDGPTPHLRSITLWNVGFNASSFEWQRLTTLALINIHIDDCLMALSQATALVQCKLHLSSARQHWRLLPEKICLPRLEMFIVGGSSLNGSNVLAAAADPSIAAININTPSQKWWGQFVLPSLRRLAASYNLLDHPGCDALQSLLSLSECRLERLRVLSSSSSTVDLDLSDYSEPVAKMWPHVGMDLANSSEIVSADDAWRYETYWQPRAGGETR
ncbi:F-box domain-containing protein [Mycena chlorophos]|uniref:F-box domain-containing protein n=1 Tax=Mycena chlorophos TaxID=658473 RepID=A0A8H6SUU7_MYCCL|nr:F-box domain-containing protein [Mycena chlorophos]